MAATTASVLYKRACVIAKELGYSEKAILRCYRDGISAGDLVMDMLNLHDMDSTFNIYASFDTIRQESDKMQTLREETLTLWKKQQCKKCWKSKVSCLALPCCHLAVCKLCCDKQCIICETLIIEWINVFVS